MLINGIPTTKIAATDRGLAYGDGLFSTIKVEFGQVQLWPLHLQRLQQGAQSLFFPEVNWTALKYEVELLATTLVAKPQAVIKIIVTRGSGGRGYSTQGCEKPLRILSCHDYPSFYQQWQSEGIKVILCQQKLAINPQLAGLKTLNRLEQVLIKHELESKQAVEGIVCDTNGLVVEGCSANIFIYKDNHWRTPKLDNCGVNGVKRRQIIELAEQTEMAIVEQDIHVEDLLNAQAVSLTNALMGIVPVKQFQSHGYSSSALSLVAQLQALIESQGGQSC